MDNNKPISNKLRKLVLENYNYSCYMCSITGIKLDLHHIIPRRLGGLNELSNLVPLCRQCHKNIEPRYLNPEIKSQYIQTTFLLSEKLLQDVKKIAKYKRTYVTAIIRDLLREYIIKNQSYLKYNH